MSKNNIEIEIQATDNATAKLNSAASSLNNLSSAGNSSSSSLSSIASSMGGCASSALSMAGGFALAEIGINSISAALESAKTYFIDYNANMEMFKQSMNTMLGSATQAKVMIDSLNDFAAKTPFDLPGVQTATKKLLAFGWQADQVIPTLTAVGDASAALGLGTEGINRMTMAIGQMKAKGTVQGDELLQLAEAGVPAYQILSEKLGLTAEQVHNIGNAGISADAAIKALQEGMEDRFGGMMDSQAGTFTGMLSTCKDDLEQILGSMGEEVFNSCKDGLSKIKGLLDGILAMTKGQETNLSDLLPQEFVSYLQTVASTVSDVFNKIKPAVSDFATSVINLSSQIFRGLCEVQTILLSIFAPVYDLIASGLAGFFTVLAYEINEVATSLKSFIDSFEETYNEINEFLTELKKSFNDFSDSLSNEFDSIYDSACESWESIKDEISSVFQSICDTISDLGDSLEDTLSSVWDSISDDAIEAFDNIDSMTGGIFSDTIDNLSALASGLEDTLSSIWDYISDDAQNEWGYMSDRLDEITNGGVSWIANNFTWLRDELNAIWDSIANSIIGKAIKFISTLGSILNPGTLPFTIGNALESSYNPANNITNTAIGNIVNSAVESTVKINSPSGGSSSSGSGGRGSSSGGGRDNAVRDAERAEKDAEKATEKVSDIWFKLSDKINSDSISKYADGMNKLSVEIEKQNKDISEAIEKGADPSMIENAKKAVADYAVYVKEKLEKNIREAWTDLTNEINSVKAKITGDKRLEAQSKYNTDLTKLDKDKDKQEKEVLSGDPSRDAEARIKIDEWFNAKKEELSQELKDNIRKAEIDSYNDSIELNNSMLEENKLTYMQKNQLNRDLLNNKIAYLQQELQSENLTAQEELNINKELASSIKSIQENPLNFAESFKLAVYQMKDASQQIMELGKQTADNLQSSFADGFFDLMTGKLENLSDIFTDFFNSILKSIANLFASSFMKFLFPSSSIFGKFLGLYNGGRVGKYASGGGVGENDFVVGEHGIELLHLDGSGATVTSTGTTQRKLKESNSCNVVVNIINESGQPVKAETQSTNFDGEKYIISTVLKAYQNNTMNIKNALKAS